MAKEKRLINILYVELRKSAAVHMTDPFLQVTYYRYLNFTLKVFLPCSGINILVEMPETFIAFL